MKFTKMQACGNDYIYINCFKQDVKNPSELAVKLSPHRFSVGGDGICLICPSDVADAKMRLFNQDGSEAQMCGNGIRCVGKFLYDKGIVRKDILRIETLSGVKELLMQVENGMATGAQVDMGEPILTPAKIPITLDGAQTHSMNENIPLGETAIVNNPITVNGEEFRITCVSMGNPHCVIFCDDVDSVPLRSIGRALEFDKNLFPERVNVEFVEVLSKNELKMRVWERGSGETFACGTGACASAVAAVLNGHCQRGDDILLYLTGGDLVISWTDDTLYMTGPAVTVYEGEIDL